MKLKLPSLFKTMEKGLVKHSPEILTGLGIASLVTATVLAVKETPKALQLIDEELDRKNWEQEKVAEENNEPAPEIIEELTPVETVKVTWKCYIPAAIAGGIGIVCILGASKVNLKRNAALAMAYDLTDTALKEYQQKVVDVVGEKKEEEIRHEVAADRMARTPVQETYIVDTGHGNTLFFDTISARYFRSDIEFIKRTILDLTGQLYDDMFIPLNDFYYAIGLEEMDSRVGDNLGWDLDDRRIDISTNNAKVAPNGQPCIILDYTVRPRYKRF